MDLKTHTTRELNKVNKLKGVALQKLIKYNMDFSNEDISIKKVLLNTLNEKSKDYYIILKPFKLDYCDFKIKYDFICIDDLLKHNKLYLYEKIKIKKWKKCSYCNNYIFAELQKTKKCLRCKKGHFKYVIENKIKNNEIITNNLLDYLLNNKFIKPVNFNLRCDFFTFNNNIFTIYEAKNKEITGLSKKDIVTSLIYANIIKKTGHKIDKLEIIFNGFFDENIEQYKKNISLKVDYEIQLKHYFNLMKEKNLEFKGIEVKKIKEHYKYLFIKEYKISINELNS